MVPEITHQDDKVVKSYIIRMYQESKDLLSYPGEKGGKKDLLSNRYYV